MSIFNYPDTEALGAVIAVDTATVVIRVEDVEKLRRMQVNRLVVLQSSRAGEHLIGVIQKIVRSVKEAKSVVEVEPTDDDAPTEENVVRVALIGTHIDRKGSERDLFRRTLETVPEIDANCFAIEGDSLTAFMRVISAVASEGQKLTLGSYTLDENAKAYLRSATANSMRSPTRPSARSPRCHVDCILRTDSCTIVLWSRLAVVRNAVPRLRGVYTGYTRPAVHDKSSELCE